MTEKDKNIKKKKQKTFTRHRNQEKHRERINQKTLTWTKNHEKIEKEKTGKPLHEPRIKKGIEKVFCLSKSIQDTGQKKSLRGASFSNIIFINKTTSVN